jgi:hypothetical protein
MAMPRCSVSLALRKTSKTAVISSKCDGKNPDFDSAQSGGLCGIALAVQNRARK